MGKATYTSNGTFTPVTGVTTYNFVVIGAGGGAYGVGNGGNGGIVKTTYTNITNNLNIIIGGGGANGGESEVSYAYGSGGGLTQVVGDNVNIISGGGGATGIDENNDSINGGDGCYNNTPAGGPGQGGAVSGLGGKNGLGGAGGISDINGGTGGAYNGSGNGLPGSTVTNAGGGGGGAGSNGITGAGSGGGGGGYNGGGGGACGGSGALPPCGGGSGSGGGSGYGGGGGGGSSGDAGAGGAGGAGGSIALLGATNVSYYTAPDSTYGNYGSGAINSQPGYVEISWEDPPISDICFPSGTPIQTDQGIVFIEKLDTTKHSINGECIQFITKTVTLDKYLILFEKNCLGKNLPNKPTIMTKDHQIMYNGLLVPAYRFLDMTSNIKKVEYNGEILYNVLLNKYSVMKVNNLTCETLNPDNAIALLYRCGFSEESKQYIKEIYNRRHIVNKK